MCRLDILKGKPGYMVEEHHGQPIVYDDNEPRADDRVFEHIGKRPTDREYQVNGVRVRCSFELSPQHKPIIESPSCILQGQLEYNPDHDARQVRRTEKVGRSSDNCFGMVRSRERRMDGAPLRFEPDLC